MTEAEFLERLDRHIESTSKSLVELKRHVAENGGLMREVRGLMREIRGLMGDIRGTLDDNRAFMRELTVRNERTLGALAEESRAGRGVLVDLHTASQRHTEAIFTLIDELRRHGLGGASA